MSSATIFAWWFNLICITNTGFYESEDSEIFWLCFHRGMCGDKVEYGIHTTVIYVSIGTGKNNKISGCPNT